MANLVERWFMLTTWIVLAAVSALPVEAMSKKERAALENADREWRGAVCRNRIPIVVRKPKKDDWTRCQWIYYTEKGGNERVKVMVSDGAAVHRAFYGGAMPPGTEFKALGWFTEKGGDHLHLELELVGQPVRLRVYYMDDWVGEVGVGRLEEFERWVRYDFLDVVSAPSEQLIEVPETAGSSGSPPAVGSSSEPAALPPDASDGPPSVEIIAVAVQPARVAAGLSTDLVINYSVSGIAPGPGFEVVEVREIYLGGDRIAGFEERLLRGNGDYPSRQPLTIPAGTAPGIYTLKAKIVMAGREITGSALFEVTAP